MSCFVRVYKEVVNPVIFGYWKALQEKYLASTTSSICLTGDGQVTKKYILAVLFILVWMVSVRCIEGKISNGSFFS
jgi:hypothetical protein